MATGFFHHIGTLLLFVATILLIITDITAPVVHNLAILEVVLDDSSGSSNHGTVNFGTFGYCLTGLSNGTYCSPSMVGYSPANVMTSIENTQFSDYAVNTTNGLSKVMILHPIATGLAFIAFVLALGAGVVGSFMAALVAVLTFVVTAVALVCDFVLFSIIKSNVNSDGSGSDAFYSVGIWTILVAGICSLLGSIIVFLTCCSSRLHRNTTTSKVDGGYNAPPRRRWL